MNGDNMGPINLGNPQEFTVLEVRARPLRLVWCCNATPWSGSGVLSCAPACLWLCALLSGEQKWGFLLSVLSIAVMHSWFLLRSLQFAELIRDTVMPGTEIVRLPATKDDPARRKPDISKALAILNWTPKTDVRDGLAKTIEYFRTEIGLGAAGSSHPTTWLSAMPERLTPA
jgi:hypothetical protein